jgi:dTDP-4-dehydrorhamnose reductase
MGGTFHADVLIIGGNGLIGFALDRELMRRGYRVSRTSRRQKTANPSDTYRLDLETLADLDAIPPADCVVLAAAETSLQQCRDNPARAAKINAEAPARIAKWADANGSRLVLLSTSAVFDGIQANTDEDSLPNPMSIYGHQKAVAERSVLGKPGGLVLRLGKVLHREQALIVSWIADLSAGRPIRPLTDLVAAPVGLHAVIDVLARFVSNRQAAGIFQFTAAHDATYADLAKLLANALGAAPELVQPVTSDEVGVRLEHRPLHATLSDKRLTQAIGISAASPHAAVAEVIADWRTPIEIGA